MRNRVSWGVVLAIILGVVFLLGPPLLRFYVDSLWFDEVRYPGVFRYLWAIRFLLAVVFGAALTGLTYLNLRIARNAAVRILPRPGREPWRNGIGPLAREGLANMLGVGSVALGVLGGIAASARWDDWIRFTHGRAVGVQDPIFNTDLGFYLFQYPLLGFMNGWLATTLTVVLMATALVYVADGAITVGEGEARVSSSARAHLSVLLGLWMVVKAWDYWLDRYGLLLQPGGVVTFGAGYADIHARLPALNILVVVALIAACGFFVNARMRVIWLPVTAVGLMVIASLAAGSLYPALIQNVVVKPNEQAREKPFIQHHLNMTRAAYGLDGMQQQTYTLGKPLAAADLRKERGTLENIRLWDYRVLSRTFHGLQRLRDYYHVREVDIDRYRLASGYRQVMLAPRELVTERLDPAQRRWTNEKLQYTHGYGMVMSAVNEADPSGRPVWLIRDLPLVTAPGLEITRPQLYYGMQDLQPVIAPSEVPELDYLADAETRTSQYAGPGGIPLASVFRRALFSAYLGDWNLTISNQVRPTSRLLLRRNVLERAATVAPFLRFDRDPYLVIDAGRLVWVLDGYTTANTYPYSAPVALSDPESEANPQLRSLSASAVNYLRNSVKVTVDAYTGELALFASDAKDPVLACYRRAFPTLFREIDQVPATLRAHFRYPEGLFSVQARTMTRFHVTSPEVFYAQSDVWEIPNEQLQSGDGSSGSSAEPLEPYYVVMRLPGETREEFVLILPFKTKRGTTMPGWMVARCDPEVYGELRLYRFPTNVQVDAPEQVDNSIQADPTISREVSLLDQRGSAVRFGNLLVLPVGSSLVYVKPLYLEAAGGRSGDSQNVIPQLEQVILAEHRGSGMRVVMRPTLPEALAALVGATGAETTAPEPPVGSPPPTPQRGQTPALQPAREAQSALEAAEQAQRSGNWAEYGRQMERLKEAIRRLNLPAQ